MVPILSAHWNFALLSIRKQSADRCSLGDRKLAPLLSDVIAVAVQAAGRSQQPQQHWRGGAFHLPWTVHFT